MTLHYVQLKLGNKSYKDKVSTEGCSDVGDFRGAIKNKFSHLLAAYDTAQLTLHQPDGITEIDPQTSVADLKEIPWKPMVVTVEELPALPPAGSSKKQLTYKELGLRLPAGKDYNDNPTFADVLFAYKNNEWSNRYRKKSYAERTDESGFTNVAEQVPFLAVRLPDLFTKDEWAKLKEWNQKTNSRIHDADLPKTSTGKYFLIIPHADYNEETISFFKTIGAKGHLYDNGSKR
ncbi:hypothetical protein MP638_001790 [Amoeboaphelidium occidentale]|nr:hypothetical protein MP638_001790 [Amoeboaphelidium occidentale]